MGHEVGDRERKSIVYHHSEGTTAERVPAHLQGISTMKGKGKNNG